jgi:hypothetical protein
MAENYVLLETIELSQSATSVTFDNLPSTGYTDLKIVGASRSSTTNDALLYRLNGTTTGYTGKWAGGTGSAPESGSITTLTGSAGGTWGRVSNAGVNGSGYTANSFSSWKMYIHNYTSSENKSISFDAAQETNATAAYMDFGALLWSNVAAITSIAFSINGSGSFVAGSTFSLYGVAATGTTPAIAPFATGGNIVAQDGTYWYHAFLSSGTFTPSKDLTCDYVVIAGGGGAARYTPSGGGAGGLRSTVTQTGGNSAGVNLETPLSLTSGTLYPVLIGAGGAGASTNTMAGVDGSATSFGGLVTTVGGGGGINESSGPARVGGSGSGGGRSWNTAGAGTANQGFAGGTGTSAPQFSGGGGGGAGAVGVNATTAGGGNGGAGVLLTSFATPTNTGVSGYYAGGGAGSSYAGTAGTGGVGGGGNGGINPTAGTSGIANTGGGGGASGADGGGVVTSSGGSGASGIVIIRYPMV